MVGGGDGGDGDGGGQQRTRAVGAAAMYRRLHLFDASAGGAGAVLASLHFAEWVNITAVLAGGGGGGDGGGSGWVAAGGDFSDVAVWSLSDATLAALGEEEQQNKEEGGDGGGGLSEKNGMDGALATRLRFPGGGGGGDCVLALAFLARPLLLASGTNDHKLRVWRAGVVGGDGGGGGCWGADVVTLSESADLGGWVTSVAFANGQDDAAAPFVIVAAGTAGADGSVQLLRWLRGSADSGGGAGGGGGDRIDLLAVVRLGCTVAWCDFVSGRGALLATASADKLVQLWRWSIDADGTAALVPCAAFPAGARFGSPDGVGGQGDVHCRTGDICIGDEAGRLYCLAVEVD